MEVNQLKTECTLTDGSQTVDAMLHLIEICYNERIVFWNCVLQLTQDQAGKLGAIAAAPVLMRLPDGRSAGLNVTHMQVISGYCELAGVGNPNS